MTMRTTIILLTTLAATAAYAQKPYEAHWTDSELRLTLPLTEAKGQGGDYAVWDTPLLTTADGDTLRLSPAVFRGKRNKKYVERGRYFGTLAAPTASSEALLGDTVVATATVSRAEAPWLWQKKATLGKEREREGCCKVETLPAETLGRLAYVPPFKPTLTQVKENRGRAGELAERYPVLQHISAYVDYTKVGHEALYVHFPVSKWELRRDLYNNAKTLDDIVEITRLIKADTLSSVKCIQIVGYASIEGPQQFNNRLAGNRANALRDYVIEKVNGQLPQGIAPLSARDFEVNNGGEGWDALIQAIKADTNVPNRERLLQIIDQTPDRDKAERLIRQLDGGRTYNYLLKHILYDQRNSGYIRIYYEYKPDPVATHLNEAIQLVKDGKAAEGLEALQQYKDDPRAWNAIALAHYDLGHTAEAKQWLRKAADQGNATAADNLRQLERVEEAKAANE